MKLEMGNCHRRGKSTGRNEGEPDGHKVGDNIVTGAAMQARRWLSPAPQCRPLVKKTAVQGARSRGQHRNRRHNVGTPVVINGAMMRIAGGRVDGAGGTKSRTTSASGVRDGGLPMGENRTNSSKTGYKYRVAARPDNNSPKPIPNENGRMEERKPKVYFRCV